MTTKRWACTAAAAALMLTATGCTVDRAGGTAAEQTVVLTFAQGNRGDPAPQLTAWADEVKRLTGGSITIEFKNGWRLGESRVEASILDDVKAGKVDLAWVGPRVFDRVGVTPSRPCWPRCSWTAMTFSVRCSRRASPRRCSQASRRSTSSGSASCRVPCARFSASRRPS